MKKVGRNDPCPCDSGKKYKQCCMQQEAARAPGSNTPAFDAAQELQSAFSHQMAGRADTAEQIYRRILHAQPKHADALHLLGILAGDRGDRGAAIELIGKAITINPDNHSYHANLGRMYSSSDLPAKAEICYRRAVKLKPDSAHYDNLGTALRMQNKFTEAADNYRRALALNPNYAAAHRNLGDLLQIQGRYAEAADSYRQALLLNPDSAEVFSNLGTTLQAQGKLSDAIENFRQALVLEPNNLRAHDNLLYTLSTIAPPDTYLEAARDYGTLLQSRAQPYQNWPYIESRAGQPLRIGLVSGDFRIHPVGFFLESLLAHLNGTAIEIIAYPTILQEDTLTARIKPHFLAWYSLANLNDAAAAQKIHADGIHILIDLGGYTSNNRLALFAWKPAPIQLSWLGYWASTGLATIDYILADRHSIPPEEQAHFSEQAWYLPNTRLCFTPPTEDVIVAPLPALINNFITFGCFNNPTKINDAVLNLWAKILNRTPSSRLKLKAKHFEDESIKQAICERLTALGIGIERIIFEGESARADYLAAYHSVDIALDPFPFTGGTTSIEGLWMGVPFITRRGDRLIAHQGESILRNMELDDWIAEDDATYIERAVAHAENLQNLVLLRQNLRNRLLTSPLCDAQRFARDFKAALTAMWQRYAESH
jgi:predicted O-linked N-acetylglucosamine transferase (SPINDLY family)